MLAGCLLTWRRGMVLCTSLHLFVGVSRVRYCVSLLEGSIILNRASLLEGSIILNRASLLEGSIILNRASFLEGSIILNRASFLGLVL